MGGGKLRIPVSDGEDLSWQESANCLGEDPDLFFPNRGESSREAKEFCRGCVVRAACLEYALIHANETPGIWGGLSERERRRMRRRQQAEALTAGVGQAALADVQAGAALQEESDTMADHDQDASE